MNRLSFTDKLYESVVKFKIEQCHFDIFIQYFSFLGQDKIDLLQNIENKKNYQESRWEEFIRYWLIFLFPLKYDFRAINVLLKRWILRLQFIVTTDRLVL